VPGYKAGPGTPQSLTEMFRSLLPRTEHVLMAITEDVSIPAKIAAVVIAFITPLHAIVGIMMMFLLFDTGSAIYLNYKVEKDRRKKCQNISENNFQKARLAWGIIDPDKLGKTIEKLFAYPAIALGCFVFDRLVLKIEPADAATIGNFSLTNLAFVLICLMDFKSFLRNMGKATGNEVYRIIEKILDRKFKDQYPDERN
jgi:hypothetical protein